MQDKLQTFDKYTNIAITINNKQHKQQQEKKGIYVLKVLNTAKLTTNTTNTFYNTVPKPINLKGIN